MIILIIVLWLAVGAYGFCANWERVNRVWSPYKLNGIVGNLFQSMLTLFLGPIGVWCVMTAGGRWGFWKEARR